MRLFLLLFCNIILLTFSLVVINGCAKRPYERPVMPRNAHGETELSRAEYRHQQSLKYAAEK